MTVVLFEDIASPHTQSRLVHPVLLGSLLTGFLRDLLDQSRAYVIELLHAHPRLHVEDIKQIIPGITLYGEWMEE